MKELEGTIQGSRETVADLFQQGQEHLATMRGLVSASGPVQERADAFAEQSVALAGVIASLEQTSIAPSVSRAAADLSAGFIAPVADGGTADLAGRQDQVMTTVRQSVAAQSQALSQAADEILSQPKVPERRFVPLSSAEAVLLYAPSFLPSWAGAISIDLLPGVLVGILAVVYGAIRRGEDRLDDLDRITAGDMLRSLELHEKLMARREAPAAEPAEAPEAAPLRPAAYQAPSEAEAPRPAENVTPLSLSERKRLDP